MSEQKNVTIDSEKIHLIAMRILGANFFIAPALVDTPIGGYRLEYQVDNGLNLEERAIRIVIDGKFQAVDESDTPMDARCELSAEFIFNVEDLKQYMDGVDKNTGMNLMHPSLGATVMGIAFSTFRGIVFTRTQGTFKDPLILPIVNPRKFLEDINRH
ncbi:MAG: hypothetical protein V4649_01000 [Bacteroidota bacterium]